MLLDGLVLFRSRRQDLGGVAVRGVVNLLGRCNGLAVLAKGLLLVLWHNAPESPHVKVGVPLGFLDQESEGSGTNVGADVPPVLAPQPQLTLHDQIRQLEQVRRETVAIPVLGVLSCAVNDSVGVAVVAIPEACIVVAVHDFFVYISFWISCLL